MRVSRPSATPPSSLRCWEEPLLTRRYAKDAHTGQREGRRYYVYSSSLVFLFKTADNVQSYST